MEECNSAYCSIFDGQWGVAKCVVVIIVGDEGVRVIDTERGLSSIFVAGALLLTKFLFWVVLLEDHLRLYYYYTTA